MVQLSPGVNRDEHATAIAGYLRRVRVRALAFYLARGVLAGAGAGALTLLIAALGVGAVASPAVAVVSWTAVAAAAGAAAWWVLRRAQRVRGSAAAELLVSVRVGLASATRSAVELAADSRARALAPGLVAAHAARVREALAEVPVRRVVPWRWLEHPALLGGLAATLLAGLLLTRVDRAASGTYALLHPGERDGRGALLAAAVDRVRARCIFPGHLHRPPLDVEDFTTLELPRGTSVEVDVRPRVAAREAVLEVGRGAIKLRPARGGLVGRFVVREDAAVGVRLREPDGRWLRDPTPRAVRAIVDQAPRVSLTHPERDRTVEPTEDVLIAWDARDDIGIAVVDLVLRTPGGREVRRRLAAFEEAGGPGKPEAMGATTLEIAATGVRPGDRVTVWIEAKDADQVSGPNVGKSAERVLTVASASSRRAETIGDLAAVLDAALDALADRLERPPPEAAAAARARLEAAAGAIDRLVQALENMAERLRRDRNAAAGDAGLYAEMSTRIRRVAAQESTLHGDPIGARDRRVAADARVVEELERDVLLLADLLGRARIDDAAAIARELEALRRQMTSLLAELRRASTPEARRALLEAIARAEARMHELQQRIAALAQEVPSDFVNTDALEATETADALAAFREAVERGDLDEAERRLADLERNIDRMARALGGADQLFAEARFGPRERAMAEAMDLLQGVETEQQQLARRSSDVRRRAAERALEATGAQNGDAARRLSRRAQETRQALERIDRRRLDGLDQEAFDRARQRLRDTEDALRTGDLGEARRMSDEASVDLDALARDLDLSQLMFPGADGRTSADARAARDASRQVGELRRDIDESIPRVERWVDPRGAQQLRGDSSRQRSVRDAAGRLAGQLEEGPDGTPLSPDGARAVREAAGSMQRAERALDHGDPIAASRAQEDAARRLTELREQLESEQQQRASGGGGGGSDGGDGEAGFRERVEIPGAEAFHGPAEMRRRLLDAMREPAPPGYEAAVRRYYEDLLR